MPREAAGAGFTRNDLQYQPEATDLTGTGALDMTAFTLSYRGEIEEFGFRVSTALVGGANVYDLVDSNNVVIASISLTAAAGGKAAVIKTTLPPATPTAPATNQFVEATTFKIRRRAGGTTVSAGTGQFYVRTRQRLQQRS